MSTFEALLELQEHDTAHDRLVHRRVHLPERAALTELHRRVADLEQRLVVAREQREEANGRLVDMERHVEATASRVTAIEKRMYSGDVTATRELLAMGAEVTSLKTRGSTLEDELLAAMEAAEPLDAEVGELEETRRGLASEVATVLAAVAAAEGEVDAELAAVAAARTQVAARVPGELTATYDRLRSTLGGVGAARLVGSSCTGCHLTIASSEVARIKREPPDALVVCEQCGRILVR